MHFLLDFDFYCELLLDLTIFLTNSCYFYMEIIGNMTFMSLVSIKYIYYDFLFNRIYKIEQQ